MTEYYKQNFYDEYAIKKENRLIAVVDSGTNANRICGELNALQEEKEAAIEGIIFADKLIEDLGGEEMKNRWRKKINKRRVAND